MNQEAFNLFNPQVQAETFDFIQISIASPEEILSWSFGDIKKPLDSSGRLLSGGPKAAPNALIWCFGTFEINGRWFWAARQETTR